jgi:hypothetical protein
MWKTRQEWEAMALGRRLKCHSGSPESYYWLGYYDVTSGWKMGPPSNVDYWKGREDAEGDWELIKNEINDIPF